MRNILETGMRKNFIRAALVLPVLMGLVPEKDRPRLIELRTRFLRQKEYRKLGIIVKMCGIFDNISTSNRSTN